MFGEARAFIELRQDKTLIGQTREGDGSTGERMARVDGEQQRFLMEDAGIDTARIERPRAHEADVEPPVRECGELRGGLLKRGLEHHLGVCRPKPPERCRQHARQGGRGDVADLDAADLSASRAARGALRSLERLERHPRFLKERAAGVREADGRASAAIEEARAESLFEVADLPAERGLGDVESVGGAAEVQGFRDRREGVELAGVEHRFLMPFKDYILIL